MSNFSFRSAMRLAVAGLCCTALTACGLKVSGAPPEDFSATLPPPPMVQSAQPEAANGAIFQASTGYAPLYYGQRAHKVGDVVNVVLTENISTSKAAASNTSRDGSFGLTTPSVGPFALNADALNSGANSSFKGSGSASKSSTLGGELSVTIAEVRPNGTALIRGEKRMKLSQGEEWVKLSGIVRLADISPENRIASTKVADARIIYSGKGSVQRASREGWLSRFFNQVSPF